MLFIPIRIRTSAPNLGIAQVVEHLIWDQEVVGAGPTTETKIFGARTNCQLSRQPLQRPRLATRIARLLILSSRSGKFPVLIGEVPRQIVSDLAREEAHSTGLSGLAHLRLTQRLKRVATPSVFPMRMSGCKHSP